MTQETSRNETNRNRVLGRQGARELTREEIDSVAGGAAHTLTVCSWNPKTHSPDGDIGEC
jgi:hypothetical protein